MVAIVSSSGRQVEQARYSAHGVPFGLPVGVAFTLLMRIRHRVCHAELGHWTRRGPLGCVPAGIRWYGVSRWTFGKAEQKRGR